ncbi:MAG: cbb3-type cytochrome c oxidase subunit I [Chloroflexi bacterium]|nr:cbb3-type cytochrome c oxidase subunit I [Chloroflexota bacterium]
MATMATQAQALHHTEIGWMGRYIFSTDHKMIAKQYLLNGLFFALFGGVLALFFRIHLASPDGFLSPDRYNSFVTMHGTLMIFWVAMPILLGFFGNLTIPLMIGARDMAFPFLNMMSYWTFFLSSVVIMASFFVPGGPFAAGWTGYAPLSANAELTGVNWGINLWVAGLALEFAAVMMGGINFITTPFNLRARGMSLMRLPLIVWMVVIASLLFMLSVGPLIAGAFMLLFDKNVGTHFFLVSADAAGDPLLWQHLFWFFGHPEVYVILIPTFGVIAEIFTASARKPLHGYKHIVFSIIGAGLLSFVVWAHHMFLSGLNPLIAIGFSITTIIISIPFLVIVVALGLTLWGGSIRFNAAFLYALGSFAIFIVGGLTGLQLGAVVADVQLHDTYFVVAHFHYVIFASVILGTYAAVHWWFPKMFGRMMNETIGKIHAISTFVLFNIVFAPMFVLGFAGYPRRYSGFGHIPLFQGYEWITDFISAAAILLVLSQLLFVFNFFYSLMAGKKADNNPWEATTLEWLAESPPPHMNWGATVPVVDRDPYEYAVDGVDYLPQGRLVPLPVRE